MDDLAAILPHAIDFSPGPTAEADAGIFAAIPGKWGICLLLDTTGQPLQLLCAKNLRATLKRRLGLPDLITEDGASAAATPSKRVDYRALVRSIRWARVDSDFEMDLVYIEAARVAFPTHWRRLIPDRSAYFVHIDPQDRHPDFARESDITHPSGQAFGPFPDKAKADRWIDLVRDAFDLCRYRNILAQTPHGKACMYKQMAKCPAPCDGSVPFETYRVSLQNAVATARSPEPLMTDLAARMKTHAANLEFEQAGKVKARLATLEQLKGFATVRPIESFRFLTIQPSGRKGSAKVFLLTASGVTELAGVCDPQRDPAALQPLIDRAVPTIHAWPREVLLGFACHHLGGSKSASRFIPADRIDPDAFQQALADAMKPASARKADETGDAVRETRLDV